MIHEQKDYIATIRAHDDFRVKVSAFNESDAWHQATRRVQDLRYEDARIGSTFILTPVSLEPVEAKK